MHYALLTTATLLSIASNAHAKFDMYYGNGNAVDGSGVAGQWFFTPSQSDPSCKCFGVPDNLACCGNECGGEFCREITNPDDGVIDYVQLLNAAKGIDQRFEYWNEIRIEGRGGGSYEVLGTNYDHAQNRIPIGGCRRITGDYHQCSTPLGRQEYFKVFECDADVNFAPGKAPCS